MTSIIVRNFRSTVVIVGLGFAAVGCAKVGPDFETPKTPVVDQWIEANTVEPDAETGLTSRSEPILAWWESFNDPILNRLVEEAYAQNLTLQIAGARVLKARAQLGIAFGELFPQSQTLGASRSQRRISQNIGPVQDIRRRLDLDTTFATTEIGFDAQWELDVWGGIRRGVESAKANLAAEVADYDDALVTLTGDVAAVYINIRALQELLEVARENIKLQQQSYNLTKLRFSEGVTTELDVQESATLLNNTKALVPGLESDLQQQKNALAVLLGQPPSKMEALLGYGAIPRGENQVAVGVPAELLRRRPDIRAAELEAAAQSAQIGVAINDLYPQFVLTGTIGFQASDAYKVFSAGSLAGLISPGVFWNVLNYGRIKNNVRAQDATFQGLVANYQNTVLEAYAEVENAMVAWQKSGEAAALYKDSVRSSQKAATIALEQYTDGLADYSRVLIAQEGVLNAQVNLIETRAQESENLVSIYKALGGGWEIRSGQEFLPGTVLAEMAHRTDWGEILRDDPEGMSFD